MKTQNIMWFIYYMASFATDQLSNPKVKPSNITFQ